MEIRIKNAAGAMMLLSGIPALAQESVTAKASVIGACASCPSVNAVVYTPGGPTLFIAFAAGVVVGYLVAKVFDRRKAR